MAWVVWRPKGRARLNCFTFGLCYLHILKRGEELWRVWYEVLIVFLSVYVTYIV